MLSVNKEDNPAGSPVKPVDTKKSDRVVISFGLFSFPPFAEITSTCHLHAHCFYIFKKEKRHCDYKCAEVMISFYAHNTSISMYFLKLEDL